MLEKENPKVDFVKKIGDQTILLKYTFTKNDWSAHSPKITPCSNWPVSLSRKWCYSLPFYYWEMSHMFWGIVHFGTRRKGNWISVKVKAILGESKFQWNVSMTKNLITITNTKSTKPYLWERGIWSYVLKSLTGWLTPSTHRASLESAHPRIFVTKSV